MTNHRFRRRLVVLEARQVDASDWDLCEDVARWCGGFCRPIDEFHRQPRGGVICIPHEDGDLFALDGDWVVRFPDGFLPVEDDVFQATYEPLVGQ